MGRDGAVGADEWGGGVGVAGGAAGWVERNMDADVGEGRGGGGGDGSVVGRDPGGVKEREAGGGRGEGGGWW